MPRDSFHSMQEGWKLRIQGLFDGSFGAKEKVGGVMSQGWKETPGRTSHGGWG